MTQEQMTQPAMYCRQCNYALVGLSENRCPECGQPFDPADPRTVLWYLPGHELRRVIKESIRAVVFLLLLWASIAGVSSGWLYWRYYAGWQAEQPAIAALEASCPGFIFRTTLSRHSGPGPLYKILVPLDYLRARVRRICAEGPPGSPVDLADLGALKCCDEVLLWNLGITDDQLKHLEGMTQLTHLDLTENPRITDQGLLHLRVLTSLAHLDLTGTNVSGKGLRTLQGLPSLSHLALGDTDVRGEDLAELKSSSSLSSLSLDGLPVTDAHLLHLKQLPLTHIYLHRTGIKDAGLAEIGQMAKLESVTLSGTAITDAGLVHLSRLSSLKWLDLDNTAVTDAGLKHLKCMTNLQHLSVRGTNVTSEGIRQLKEALPSLYVPGM